MSEAKEVYDKIINMAVEANRKNPNSLSILTVRLKAKELLEYIKRV